MTSLSSGILLVRVYSLRCLVALILLLLPLSSLGQYPGWQSHTSMRQVTDFDIVGNMVWTATQGGVFSYDLDSGVISRYTTVEGLNGINASAIAVDTERSVAWLGYSNGVLDRLDVTTGEVRTFLDISRAVQFASRSINSMEIAGDSLLIATDFGLVVFDAERNEVRDSYTRFGFAAPGTAVRDILVGSVPDGSTGFWLATDAGVVYGSLTSPNLQEPGEWTIEREGLPADRTFAITVFNGDVFVASEADAYRRGPDGVWSRAFLSGNPIVDLISTPDHLVALDQFRLTILDGAGGRQEVSLPGFSRLAAVAVDDQGEIWVGDRLEGLARCGSIPFESNRIEPEQRVSPDGPEHHFFSDFSLDPEGVLWAAGALGAGTGFYSFRDNQWSSYTARTDPALAGRGSFFRVHADRAGNIWAGSGGSGLARRTSEGDITTYDHQNSPLNVAPGTNSFVVVRGISSDAEGRVWVTNEFASPHLSTWHPDEGWNAVPDPTGGGIPGTSYYERIFIDSNDQKWVTLRQGMIVLDTGNDPGDLSQRRLRYYGVQGTGGRGLPDLTIRSVVEDKSGRIWIGTARGVAFFFAPALVFSNDPNAYEPQWPISDGAFFLRDLNVNYLAVDPANRIWIASNSGAWLIAPRGDGYEIVHHFTTDNSPLFSNNVIAVAVQEHTGDVYMATDQGALTWHGDATTPAATAGDLFIYPNPVRSHENGDFPVITIEGLVDATDLRILTASGDVVASISTRGGRAQWDGRDRNGNSVPSGMYLVVAVGRDGEGASFGKIAVIR